MQNFEFVTVPHILVERGAAARLGEALRQRYTATRLCVVTDRFLSESGLLAPALCNLADHGWQVTVIDNVQADPPDTVILEAAKRAREASAEVVLGLGGGSSMDVAKLIAVLCASDQPLADMYGVGNVKGPRLPLVLMPTTAGTGSEVTAISIVTTGQTTKAGVVSPVLMADLAVLDAELTVGLPAQATAATGIDAMVHAIEAYTSARLKNPVSDCLAVRALQMLAGNLLTACRDGANLDARSNMLVGAMLAGQAFANAPVAAVHALAYPLGGHFHVAHGLSNALVLDPVLRFNLPAATAQYAELARAVFPEGCPADDASAARHFIEQMGALVSATGIPKTLREVGVEEGHLRMLAADALKQQRLLVNNPRPVTEEDAFEIYQAVF